MSEFEISKGTPPEEGAYVVYIDHKHVTNYPQKEILMWVRGKWGYRMSDQFFRGTVHGWIGPLPSPLMKDLNAVCVKYAISIKPDGYHGAFQDGPFDNIRHARNVIGEKGQYIFELHLDQESEAIGKWSEKKQKWLKKKNG